MVKRFVSLLSAEAGNYEKIIKKIEAQNYNELHFDIMDGHFVKNFAFGPGLIKSLRKITKLPFQAHLEIENPGEYIDMFIECGCDIITLHPQTCKIEKKLKYLRAKNIITSVFADSTIFFPVRKKPLCAITTASERELKPGEYKEIKVDTEDHVTIMFKFEDNIKGVLIAAQVCPGRKQFIEWEINGSEKSLNWNGEEPNSLWVGHRSAITLKSPSFLPLKKDIESRS